MAAKWGKRGKEIVGSSIHLEAEQPKRASNKLAHVLVVESKRLTTKQRAKQLAQKIVSHKRFKPAVGAFVAIVVIGSLVAYFGRDKQQPTVSKGPKCTYAMLEKLKPNLAPENASKLEPQIREIEKTPGYDQDPNCLFAVTTFYINMSDAPKAREMLGKLEKAYIPREGYETIISEVTKTPEELKPIVDFLEKQAAATKNIGPDGAIR